MTTDPPATGGVVDTKSAGLRCEQARTTCISWTIGPYRRSRSPLWCLTQGRLVLTGSGQYVATVSSVRGPKASSTFERWVHQQWSIKNHIKRSCAVSNATRTFFVGGKAHCDASPPGNCGAGRAKDRIKGREHSPSKDRTPLRLGKRSVVSGEMLPMSSQAAGCESSRLGQPPAPARGQEGQVGLHTPAN